MVCITLVLASCHHNTTPIQEPEKDVLPPPVSEQQETTVTDTTVPDELIDLYGESVIEPEKDDYGYIRLSPDSDNLTNGLYPICVWSSEQERNLYGFINSNGKLVVEPKYPVAYASSSGYAVAGLDGIHTDPFGEQIENAYTYINDNGEECVGIYTKAGTFSENLAVVSDSKFENYIIDNNGTVISKLDSDTVACGVFSSNRLLFYSEKAEKYGYLNEKGEIIIQPVYKNANSFSDGLAAVETESGKLAYIDTDGNMVVETEAEAYSAMFTMFPGEPTCNFSEGIAKVENYYIDKTGTKLNIQNGTGMHSNGLIPVFGEDGSQGYANTDGEVVIPCKFRWARTFMDCGLAMVFSYDKGPHSENAPDNSFGGTALRGFMNTKGETVIPLEYYDRFDSGASHSYPVPSYGCGVIELYKNGYTYYFNTDGVLLGKKPENYNVLHNGVSYSINLAEYYDSH